MAQQQRPPPCLHPALTGRPVPGTRGPSSELRGGGRSAGVRLPVKAPLRSAGSASLSPARASDTDAAASPPPPPGRAPTPPPGSPAAMRRCSPKHPGQSAAAQSSPIPDLTGSFPPPRAFSSPPLIGASSSSSSGLPLLRLWLVRPLRPRGCLSAGAEDGQTLSTLQRALRGRDRCWFVSVWVGGQCQAGLVAHPAE